MTVPFGRARLLQIQPLRAALLLFITCVALQAFGCSLCSVLCPSARRLDALDSVILVLGPAEDVKAQGPVGASLLFTGLLHDPNTGLFVHELREKRLGLKNEND